MIITAPWLREQPLDLVEPLLGDLQPLAVAQQPAAALAPAQLVGREVAEQAAHPDDRDQRQQRDLALAGDEAADDHGGLARRDEAQERAGLRGRRARRRRGRSTCRAPGRRPRAPSRSSAAGSRRTRSGRRSRSRPARAIWNQRCCLWRRAISQPASAAAAASQVNFMPRRRAGSRRRAGARRASGSSLRPNTVGPEPVTIGCATPACAQRLERGVDRGAERAGGGLRGR